MATALSVLGKPCRRPFYGGLTCLKRQHADLRFSHALKSKVTQVCAYTGYLQAFSDTHMLMSTLGAKNEDLTMKLLDSLRKYVR